MTQSRREMKQKSSCTHSVFRLGGMLVKWSLQLYTVQQELELLFSEIFRTLKSGINSLSFGKVATFTLDSACVSGRYRN